MGPIAVGGPKTEAGDPPLRSDEDVRLLVVVRDGDEGWSGGPVSEIQRPADVLAVDDDLAQHGDHGAGGWFVVVVRARRRRTSSSGLSALRRFAPRSVKTSNRKPAAASSL